MARKTVDIDQTRSQIRHQFALWDIDPSEFEIVWEEDRSSGRIERCCQCDQDIPVDDSLKAWREHIRSHARRKLVKPIIFAGRDNEGKLHVAQEKVKA